MVGPRTVPLLMSALATLLGTAGCYSYTDVDAGAFHTCAVTESGEVRCWGCGKGKGALKSRIDLGQCDPPEGEFAAVSAGWMHTCALTAEGTAECWGCEEYDEGQCDAPDSRFSVVRVGAMHTCGLTPEDEIQCWGCQVAEDDYGQCDAPQGRYIDVAPGIGGVSDVTCAVDADGIVLCWGEPYWWDVGWNDDLTAYLSADNARYSSVSVGADRVCGVTTEGEIRCWGCQEESFLAGSDGMTFSRVATGNYHACGLTHGGEVECYGCDSCYDDFEDRGQCSAPSTEFTDISAGMYHSCGLTPSGRVKCWGSNAYGQIGIHR